jgi:hypothetical protein
VGAALPLNREKRSQRLSPILITSLFDECIGDLSLASKVNSAIPMVGSGKRISLAILG